MNKFLYLFLFRFMRLFIKAIFQSNLLILHHPKKCPSPPIGGEEAKSWSYEVTP
jgi:hypothetical protein